MVVAHDLLKYRQTDDVTETLFSLFCPTWRAVLKLFASLFWIQQVNIKNICLKERKTKKPKKKRVLCDFKMPKLEEIFKKVVIVLPL